MKVFLTGANGFLGSWLAKRLIADGHEVHALVRKNSDLSELAGLDINYHIGDVTDIHSLLSSAKGMDAVFHLAGVIAYKKSQREIMEKVNVLGTSNVIDVVREYKIPRMLHLSSVVAVGAGESPNEVLDENSTYNLAKYNFGYFETKHKAEELVKKACQKGEIDAVMVNPSTIYGAGDARKGSRGVQLKVAQGKFGFYTSGGVNVVAVEDVIDGIISAWKHGRSGERYILAGENLLIKDLFAMIALEAGVPAPKKQLPNWLLITIGKTGDFLESIGFKSGFSEENARVAQMYHWFKNEKAVKELGFKPRPAREAIHNSVQWIKKQGML